MARGIELGMKDCDLCVRHNITVLGLKVQGHGCLVPL